VNEPSSNASIYAVFKASAPVGAAAGAPTNCQRSIPSRLNAVGVPIRTK
jgi:hypothetical protein